MSTVTENDLKRLEDLLINGLKSLENNLEGLKTDLDGLKTDVREIKGEIKALDARIQGIEIQLATAITKTEGIEKRVDDLNSRLNIMTIGFLSIVGVLVAGILGIIGKIVFFPNNP